MKHASSRGPVWDHVAAELDHERPIPDGVVLPADVAPAERRSYVTDLIARFLVLAKPG